MKYRSKLFFSILLAGLLLCAMSCKKDAPPPPSDTLPDSIETVVTDAETDPASDTDPVTDAVTDDVTDDVTEPEQETEESEPETEPTISVTDLPASKLPDYGQYVTASRIESVLSAQKTYAFTAGGVKFYENGQLKEASEGIVTVNGADGSLTLDAAKIGALVGKSDLTGSTPEEIARALGMGVAVYDYKMVLFYEGEEPLHTYEDLYTYEAMHLYMKNAGETEIVNALIDLPSRISNNENNSIFYTAPDLNLGIQTSVYYAQMGQVNGLTVAPSLVAGEGKHKDNFTTVRVFNNQNICTTQFLAFDATVMGGVQVAAAQVGEDVLIATTPFADHGGKGGDVRVFDTFGMLRMTIDLRSVMAGPYTIVTGHFAEDVNDEVLLVASQNTNENGELTYVIISLSDGSVIAKHTLNCSFALKENTTGIPVQFTVRENRSGTDSVILYFNSVQAIYEGDAQKAAFDNSGLTLPADATGVSASNVAGQKYLVALPAREGQEDISYMTIYNGTDTAGSLLDVGFRENRFFSTAARDYNDDRYVSKGTFCHLRQDYSGNALAEAFKASDYNTVEQVFENSTLADYQSGDADTYAARLANEYLMLEPCFTHRWHKTSDRVRMLGYKETFTGITRYSSLDSKGENGNYLELDSEFLTMTYADGILELAKLRLYPMRDFLQTTAVAFRGEGGNPEHLVGVSPVHEQEICVGESVGDYNHYMIEGFRTYLLERYGSVENINRTFGTNFADRASIDPPRNTERGAWDTYAGDYFTEWSLYNRYIVSKRIMESYREALLAGYPPESISAHSIPEGEAVSGFLGQADTRLSPIDVILTCGTAYGGTRYGYFYNDPLNLVTLAKAMGHWNVTLGEYGAMTTDNTASYRQLKSLWKNGVRMVHQMDFGGQFTESEQYAIDRLYDENLPRPGYTGGTTGSIGVQTGGKAFNIVQIGAGSDSSSVGLLKSIDNQGKWEGSVYLVPFHTHVMSSEITALQTPVEGTANTFSTGLLVPPAKRFEAIKNSDQAEITFTAAKVGTDAAWVTIEAYHDGNLLKDSVTTYQLTEAMTAYRYVLSNQLYESDLEIRITFHTAAGNGSMDAIKLENLYGTLQVESAGFRYYNGSNVRRMNNAHAGGVTFDILDRDVKY